jgi:hypothetical protein
VLSGEVSHGWLRDSQEPMFHEKGVNVLARVRKGVALTLLAVVPGCTSVRPVTAPAPFILTKHPGVVFVEKDDRTYALLEPKVSGDSIIGLTPKYLKPFGFALPTVREVRAAQPDATRTALLVGGLAGVAGALLYVAGHTSSTPVCQQILGPGGIFTSSC